MSKSKWSERRSRSEDKSNNTRAELKKQTRGDLKVEGAWHERGNSPYLKWFEMSLGNFAVFLWVSSAGCSLLAASFITEVLNFTQESRLFLSKLWSQHFREGDVRWSFSFPPNFLLYFFIFLYTFLCLAVQVEVRMIVTSVMTVFWAQAKFLGFFQLLQDPCNFSNILVLWKDFWQFWFLALGETGEKYQWTFPILWPSHPL